MVFNRTELLRIIPAATDEHGEIYFLSPLLNFNSELPEVKLSDSVIMCRPNDDETKIIQEDTASDLIVHSWSFVVRSAQSTLKDQPIDLAIQSAPYRFCTALRLLKQGTVGLGSQYLFYSPPVTLLSAIGGEISRYLDTFGEYYLKADEVQRLSDIHSDIEDLDRERFPWLNLAIVRFEFSYHIAQLYSPIDLMIALEALYLADDKELSYKLAMRAAYLLRETPEQRSHIFSTLVAAYRVRSKLVHGIDVKHKIQVRPGLSVSLFELTHQVRQILRESILAFIHLAKSASHKDLTRSLLDENILTKGTLLNRIKPTDSEHA